MIFGTDGLRATVGQYPLTEAIIVKLSKVLSNWLPKEGMVVIGCDTRYTADTVKSWILSHLGPFTVLHLGIVPTPVVAYETKAHGADLGIMVTASHNPSRDNGLKFFDKNGLKIKYEQALAWSNEVEAMSPQPNWNPAEMHNTPSIHYQDFISRHFKAKDFKGLRIGFDFAHGAGAFLVKDLISKLGINAVFLGDGPDGRNINKGLGALHPEKLGQLVVYSKLDAGFAFDGDGDRLMAVDSEGEPLHGDVVLYLLRNIYKKAGLPVDKLVGTVMCGMGLEQLLAHEGTELLRTDVGDQHVLAEVLEKDLLLGGEPSGHIIQRDLFPMGDGFLAALRLARELNKDRTLLEVGAASVPIYPVFEKSYRVKFKPALSSLSAVSTAIDAIKRALGNEGRQIIRYSGTEPKLRVFVEAPDLDPLKDQFRALENAIAKELQ